MCNPHYFRIDIDSICVLEEAVCDLAIDDAVVFISAPLTVSHVSVSPFVCDKIVLECGFVLF